MLGAQVREHDSATPSYRHGPTRLPVARRLLVLMMSYSKREGRFDDLDRNQLLPALHGAVPHRRHHRGRPRRRRARRPGRAAVRRVHLPQGPGPARDPLESRAPAPQLAEATGRFARADRERAARRRGGGAPVGDRRPPWSELGRDVHGNVEHRVPDDGRHGRVDVARARVDDVLLRGDDRPARHHDRRRGARSLAGWEEPPGGGRRLALRRHQPRRLEAVHRREPGPATPPGGGARHEAGDHRPPPHGDRASRPRPPATPTERRCGARRRHPARAAARRSRRRRVRRART